MKRLTLLLLFWLSSSVWADDTVIAGYIDAQLYMLQTQVDQLNASITLLGAEALTSQEKFERIGEPSFAAVDQTLKNNGYTVQSFYQFASDHETAITAWLLDHRAQADLIQSLERELELLVDQYDELINSTTAN